MSAASEYFSARENWPHKDSMLTVFRYMLAGRVARDRNVLELGCGNGEGSRIIAPVAARYTGVDYKPHWKDADYSLPRGARFVEGDVADLPGKWTGRYDIVVAFELIEHLSDPARFAAEAKRVLKPGGTLLISTPNFDLVSRGPGRTRKPLFEHHRHEFSAGTFKSFLKRSELDCAVIGLSQLSVPGGRHRRVLCALGEALLELRPGTEWPTVQVASAQRLAKPLPLEFAQSLVAVSGEAVGCLTTKAQASARMSAEQAAALSVRWFLWRKNEHLREALTVIENRTAHLADLEETVEAREETIQVLSERAESTESALHELEKRFTGATCAHEEAVRALERQLAEAAAEHEKALAQVTETLDSRNTHLADLEKIVAARENTIKVLTENAQGAESALHELGKSCKEATEAHQEAVRVLEQELSKVASDHKAALAQVTERLNSTTANLSELDKIVAAREKTIKALRERERLAEPALRELEKRFKEATGAHEKALRELQKQSSKAASEHEKTLARITKRLTKSASAAEESLAAARTVIEAREEEITKLREIVDAREEHIARLEDPLKHPASETPEKEE